MNRTTTLVSNRTTTPCGKGLPPWWGELPPWWTGLPPWWAGLPAWWTGLSLWRTGLPPRLTWLPHPDEQDYLNLANRTTTLVNRTTTLANRTTTLVNRTSTHSRCLPDRGADEKKYLIQFLSVVICICKYSWSHENSSSLLIYSTEQRFFGTHTVS